MSQNSCRTKVLQGVAVGILLTQVGYYLWDLYKKRSSDDSANESSDARQGKSACAIGTPHASASIEEFQGCVYADYNATTPVFEEVQQAMLPFTHMHFGNPSSSHIYGKSCKAAVEEARRNVAELIHAESEHCIVFTGCGTESDNGAIDIALHHWRTAPHSRAKGTAVLPRVISSAIEHPGILRYLLHLRETEAIDLVLLPVDNEGFINPDDLASELTNQTALVTLMHSNNEVGTIQNIRKFSAIIRNYNEENFKGGNGGGILFHSDAAQSIGKVVVDVAHLGLDLCTIVGHKFGAPKGIGALYIRECVRTKPILYGGGQEGGVRSGTENVLLIAGLGAASRVALRETRRLCIYMLQCKLLFITKLKAIMSRQQVVHLVRYNGPSRHYQSYIPRPPSRRPSGGVLNGNGMPGSVGPSGEYAPVACHGPAPAGATCGLMGASELAAASTLADDIQELLMLVDRIEAVKTSLRNAPAAPVAAGNGAMGGDGGDERVILLHQLEHQFDAYLSQLPNTISISFAGIKSNMLMTILEKKVACSAGSACHGHSAGLKMSDVLAAMHVPLSYGLGTLRVSFGRHTTMDDVHRVVDAILESIAILREDAAHNASTCG